MMMTHVESARAQSVDKGNKGTIHDNAMKTCIVRFQLLWHPVGDSTYRPATYRSDATY